MAKSPGEPRGFRWGGRTFTNRRDFERWLNARGGSIDQWAIMHPTAAQMIGVPVPQLPIGKSFLPGSASAAPVQRPVIPPFIRDLLERELNRGDLRGPLPQDQFFPPSRFPLSAPWQPY